MRINHNIAALNTYRQLTTNNTSSSKAIEKLSSGLRINRAGDDAAGLAISEKMRGQIRGLEMASKNAQDGVSLIQTAEGALNETHSILQRMRELAVQSANDTNDTSDRGQLQEEVTALLSEIDRIANSTEFNNKKLLDGSLSQGLTGTLTNTVNAAAVKIITPGNLVADDTVSVTQLVTHAAESAENADDGEFQNIVFEFTLSGGKGTATVTFTKAELDAGTISKTVAVGANGVKLQIDVADASDLSTSTGDGPGTETAPDALTVVDNSITFHIGANAGQNLKLGISNLSAEALNISTVDISTQNNANSAITAIQNAVDSVSSERAKLGAAQNRLEHTIANLGTAAENLTAAESRIRDVDMAKEIMEFTKTSILTQAAQAMLAQANQQPQGVLQLLR
jgi:flagellin